LLHIITKHVRVSSLGGSIASAPGRLPGQGMVQHYLRALRLKKIYHKFQNYTMIPESFYVDNLIISESLREVPGCVVECGVWRGGMCGGIAEVMGPKRRYFLFDSFEGLPPAKDIDGPAARAWQANKDRPGYYDNCRASVEDAERAMRLSGASSYELIKGWFEETLTAFRPPQEIALLRLDGDWYESVRTCLRLLYPHVSPQGLIIIDDYYAWDGCARATHEFLAECKDAMRLKQFQNRVCVLVRGRQEICG
jgi:O-methyltransferase